MEKVRKNEYLSLNPYLEDISFVTKIQAIIPQYDSYSLRKKISAIKTCSQPYKGIIFYRDYALAALFILLHPVTVTHKKLVFHEFYLPPLRNKNNEKSMHLVMGGGKWLILNTLFKILFHTFNKIIVHSSEEVKYLSKRYHEPASKFEFIPYFSYESRTDNAVYRPIGSDPIFCSAGNNRDFHTFAKALSLMHYKGCIVGASRDDLPKEASLEIYSKVPREEYDRLIKKCDVIVITLYRGRYRRSLGQILLMKAFALRIPCIVARNPYILDYCDEHSVVFYEPESVESLCKAIQKIKSMPYDEMKSMTEHAYSSLKDKTRPNYLRHIEKVLNDL